MINVTDPPFSFYISVDQIKWGPTWSSASALASAPSPESLAVAAAFAMPPSAFGGLPAMITDVQSE